MANMFRQRLIKPGRDLNYSEGQKVLANAAIKADQIVYIMGSDGPFSKVDVADADAAGRANGRLLIAKHDIPAGGYGVCLPWKLVTTKDTSGAGVAVGDAVYLSATPGTTVASNLTLTAPAAGVNVVVGRVTVAATVANGAAIMVQAASPESRVVGGTYSASATTGVAGSPVEVFKVFLPDTDNVELTLDYPIIVVDAYVFSAGTTTGNVDISNNTASGPNRIMRIASGTAADAIVRQTAYVVVAKASIAAGAKMIVEKSAGDAGDFVVISAIRA